jgi:hypothetical protein
MRMCSSGFGERMPSDAEIAANWFKRLRCAARLCQLGVPRMIDWTAAPNSLRAGGWGLREAPTFTSASRALDHCRCSASPAHSFPRRPRRELLQVYALYRSEGEGQRAAPLASLSLSVRATPSLNADETRRLRLRVSALSRRRAHMRPSRPPVRCRADETDGSIGGATAFVCRKQCGSKRTVPTGCRQRSLLSLVCAHCCVEHPDQCNPI